MQVFNDIISNKEKLYLWAYKKYSLISESDIRIIRHFLYKIFPFIQFIAYLVRYIYQFDLWYLSTKFIVNALKTLSNYCFYHTSSNSILRSLYHINFTILQANLKPHRKIRYFVINICNIPAIFPILIIESPEVFYSIYVIKLSIIYNELDTGFGIQNFKLIP